MANNYAAQRYLTKLKDETSLLVYYAETFIAESADDSFARTKALDNLQKAVSTVRELLK